MSQKHILTPDTRFGFRGSICFLLRIARIHLLLNLSRTSNNLLFFHPIYDYFNS